jgi:creatinine amidohydrolase/Fe(II)-dependent formamide hydrolase-like protein
LRICEQEPRVSNPYHRLTARLFDLWRRRVARPPTESKRWSAAKLLVSAIAGMAIAVFAVSRPLTAPLPNTISMVDMTWLEVRSAIAHGYTTVIVPSGGIEENGPHMVLGKHDYIVRYTAERIASELKNTLVAPVVSFVPQGDFSPPTGNMQFPGTIGVSDSVYAGLLEGIARSLKSAGFKTICFIADHGESQPPQNDVAARLTQEWMKDHVTVVSVADYYADEPQTQYLLAQGETRTSIGFHAGITDTSELLAAHPEGVDLRRFAEMPFTFAASGASGDPMRASVERGKALLDIKIAAAVRQIKASLPTQ